MLVMVACTTSSDNMTSRPESSPTSATPTTNPAATASTAPSTPAQPSTSPPETSSATADPGVDGIDGIDGTIVRFTSGGTHIDVTMVDSPTTRDFLSMLPLTLSLEEFNGREKISYLPRELDTNGSQGSNPEDGDLIYFLPWANIGFYYNAEGIGYSDQVIRLGTFDATLEQLAQLENGDVTVTALT